MKSLRSLLLLAAFAVIALVLRDYLAFRDSSEGISLETLPALSEDIGAQSQSWRWTQSTGDSTRIEVSAGDFVQGADGRETVLRSVVLRIFREESRKRDRVESAEMRMLDSGELFSEGETVITLGISDRRASQPVVVHASGVTFGPAENSARTDRPVRYEFESGHGSSMGARYNAQTGTLRMLSDVSLERFGNGAAEPPTMIEAGGLLYREQEARIDLTGGVTVRQGGRWMECDRAVLWLNHGRVGRIDCEDVAGGERTAARETTFSALRAEAEFGAAGELLRVRGQGDTRFTSMESGQAVEVRGNAVDLHYDPGSIEGRSLLSRVEARDAARASLEEPSTGTRNTMRSERLLLVTRPGSSEIERIETLHRGWLEQLSSDQDSPSRTLEADRIRLRYRSGSQIESLTATGDAGLVQASARSGGPALRTWSASLEAMFDPETATITGIRQLGRFRFEDDRLDGGSLRTGSADEALFDLEGGGLALAGTAVVSDGGSRISADRIVLDRETGRIEGRGNVAVHFAPDGDGDERSLPTGLFAGQQPVFATSDALDSDPRTNTLEYRGEARLWQGRNRIDADEIILDREAIAMRATGHVKTAWVDGESGESDRPELSVVRAKGMVYDQSAGHAVFQEGVDFRRGDMRVLSDELRTSLGGAQEGRPGGAVATGGVRIAQFATGAGTRGFGDRAEFRLDDSEVILTGEPARILGPDGTETRGGRLTFRAAGDSLLVLGHGADRAYTYRPASP